MDIVAWLRSLGLGKYEAAFRENDIDETVLPSLTHENLKELGVTSLGHRVKLLDAIAALRNTGSAQAPSATVAPARPMAAAITQASVVEAAVGERRHITAASSRWPVYCRGARHPRTKRRARAGDAVPIGAGQWRQTPFGAAPSHTVRRSGRGNRHPDAALGARTENPNV